MESLPHVLEVSGQQEMTLWTQRSLLRELAALWKVDRKTVYEEISAGRLGCVRVGPARRTIRIPPAALAAWEAEQLGTAEPLPNLSLTVTSG